MKIICVTHSSRPFFEARCSLNFLGKRFIKNESSKIPPFESFPSISEAVPYEGALTLWKVDSQENHVVSFIREYQPGYKIQFATFYKDRLLVYGSDRLEILDTAFNHIKTITGPHIVGGHTVHVGQDGYAWLTSAPGDLILKVDIDSGRVMNEIPVPDHFGPGVDFNKDDDFRDHYIPTDYQRTHLNSAVPVDGNLLITLLIQGVVGELTHDGQFREYVRGFTGCHGGRLTHDSKELYLTDSPAGLVWFFDRKTGHISDRFQIDSSWVHDTVQIGEDIFVAGLSDRNCLQLFSRTKMAVVGEEDCSDFGDSVMFVNCCEIDDDLWKGLSCDGDVSRRNVKGLMGANWVPSLSNTSFWQKNSGLGLRLELVAENFHLTSSQIMTNDAMIQSCDFNLPAGQYRVGAEIVCQDSSRVSFGLLDVSANEWLVQLVFDPAVSNAKTHFVLGAHTTCRLVVSSLVEKIPTRSDVLIKNMSMQRCIENSNSSENSVAIAENILPPLKKSDFWAIHKIDNKLQPIVKLINPDGGKIRMAGASPLKFDYLIESPTLHLAPGIYKVQGEIFCDNCSVSIGILDVKMDSWLEQLVFCPGKEYQEEFLKINSSENSAIKVIISSANSDEPRAIDMVIKSLALTCEEKIITLDTMSV
jgi:hypothetical protein